MLAHFLSVAALKLAVVAQIKTEGGSVVIAVDASQDAGFMIGPDYESFSTMANEIKSEQARSKREDACDATVSARLTELVADAASCDEKVEAAVAAASSSTQDQAAFMSLTSPSFFKPNTVAIARPDSASASIFLNSLGNGLAPFYHPFIDRTVTCDYTDSNGIIVASSAGRVVNVADAGMTPAFSLECGLPPNDAVFGEVLLSATWVGADADVKIPFIGRNGLNVVSFVSDWRSLNFTKDDGIQVAGSGFDTSSTIYKCHIDVHGKAFVTKAEVVSGTIIKCAPPAYIGGERGPVSLIKLAKGASTVAFSGIKGSTDVIDDYDSCEDEIRNFNETATDCGGVCEGCGAGESCVINEDCETGLYCNPSEKKCKKPEIFKDCNEVRKLMGEKTGFFGIGQQKDQIFCENTIDNGGWAHIASVSGKDGKSWECSNNNNDNMCAGSAWRTTSRFGGDVDESVLNVNRDHKNRWFNELKGNDLMFYNFNTKKMVAVIENVLGNVNFPEFVRRIRDRGPISTCSRFVKVKSMTEARNPFCADTDPKKCAQGSPRLGIFCRDEEGWSTRDFNLFTIACDNCNWGGNYGNKPGIAVCRRDPGHSGGNCVDISEDTVRVYGNSNTGNSNDGRQWGRQSDEQGAIGIFIR